MAADLPHLLSLPRVASNHPGFRCARLAWTQDGVDYLVASDLNGHDAALRLWKARMVKASHRLGPLQFVRLVVSTAEFPMGYHKLHEPLAWFRRLNAPTVIRCANILQKVRTVNFTQTPNIYCNRPIPEGEDLSCLYCGRPVCRVCRTRYKTGTDRPICWDCEATITKWDNEHLP